MKLREIMEGQSILRRTPSPQTARSSDYVNVALEIVQLERLEDNRSPKSYGATHIVTLVHRVSPLAERTRSARLRSDLPSSGRGLPRLGTARAREPVCVRANGGWVRHSWRWSRSG